MFYQKCKYYTGNKVKILEPKLNNLSEKSLRFIATCIQRALIGKSWGEGSTEASISAIRFFLPTKKNQIDFEFMESFIGELETRSIVELENVSSAELEKYLKVTGLESYTLTKEEENTLSAFKTVQWDEYRMGDLFSKVETVKLPYKAGDLPKEPTGEFVLPCLTSSFNNQGLNYYIPKSDAPVLRNVISLPSNSDVYRAYYQPHEFTVLSDAYVIHWARDDRVITAKQYLFMVMCINKVTNLPIYSYKNKLGGWNIVKNKYIQLPTKNGRIDFEFMDRLISAIQKLVIKDIVLFSQKKNETMKHIISENE